MSLNPTPLSPAYCRSLGSRSADVAVLEGNRDKQTLNILHRFLVLFFLQWTRVLGLSSRLLSSLCELRDKLHSQIQSHHRVYEDVSDCLFGLQVFVFFCAL